ncbi:ComF family protein [Chitinilyticum aquatile]|uniref:ComF family protein n=1 Tax=Chitinilyticum aquatile TaxID=362520 RepID=UPI001B7F8158|nr:ComF family protein [Chitinilyticum aquatile]
MSNFGAAILNNFRRAAGLLDRVLPCRCVLCQTSGREALCSACLAGLPWLPRQACPRCALPTADGQLCGSCLRAPPAFDACHALLGYQSPVSELVMAGKYGGRWQLWPLFGQLMAQHRPALAAGSVLIPLPLHASRLRERGFNQALELALPLARASNLSLRHDLLVRTRDTGHQSRLSRKARHRNLRKAFAAAPAVAGLDVIVVDDVMTSGASLDAAARALKAAGAASVTAWVLARTLPHGRKQERCSPHTNHSIHLQPF